MAFHLDLRRLQAFVAIAEEGNLTRAAERLGIRQPPLTRLLRGMEADLGVLLFRRMARGMQPTQAGEVLLEEARAVLERAAGLQDAVRRAARGEQGRLAVGFTSSAALHPFVTTVLRRFRESVPMVRMELDEAGTAELVDGILQGRLDAAFVRSPVGSVPGIVVEPVLEEPMVAAFPSGHELATSGAPPLTLAALAREPFVLYRRPSGPGLHDAIMTACRQAGFTPTVVQEAPRLPSTLSLVAAGLGLSLVPASMRRLAVAGVVYRALVAGSGPSAPVHLALRRGRGSATANRFRLLVRELASDRHGLSR